MPNTLETDLQTEEFGANDRLEAVNFERVCIEILTRFNIHIDDVVKTLKEVYANVMDRKKRSGHKVGIQDIRCDLVFRKLESPNCEDVLLVFGPHQLVIIDVVPFKRINPNNGEKTSTAALRICPGSFGKFSDKYPKTIKEKTADTRKAVAMVEKDTANKEDTELAADGTDG